MRIDSLAAASIGKVEPALPALSQNRLSATGKPLSLSPTGRLIMSVHQSLRELPPVREDVVGFFRAQVSDGTYCADSDAIARAMLDANREVAC